MTDTTPTLTLQVDISGSWHSGKTNAAVIIAKALAEAGLEDIIVNSLDGDFATRAMSFNANKAAEQFKTIQTTINDTCGHPGGTAIMRHRVNPLPLQLISDPQLELDEEDEDALSPPNNP